MILPYLFTCVNGLQPTHLYSCTELSENMDGTASWRQYFSYYISGRLALLTHTFQTVHWLDAVYFVSIWGYTCLTGTGVLIIWTWNSVNTEMSKGNLSWTANTSYTNTICFPSMGLPTDVWCVYNKLSECCFFTYMQGKSLVLSTVNHSDLTDANEQVFKQRSLDFCCR